MLQACGLEQQLQSFIEGFNSSEHIFFIFDVGKAASGAENKLLGALGERSLALCTTLTCHSLLQQI